MLEIFTCWAPQSCDVHGSRWFGGAVGDWPDRAGLSVAGLVAYLPIGGRAGRPSKQGLLCDGVVGVLYSPSTDRRAVAPRAPRTCSNTGIAISAAAAAATAAQCIQQNVDYQCTAERATGAASARSASM